MKLLKTDDGTERGMKKMKNAAPWLYDKHKVLEAKGES
jgi:hypothetical protein